MGPETESADTNTHQKEEIAEQEVTMRDKDTAKHHEDSPEPDAATENLVMMRGWVRSIIMKFQQRN
jgi:hypothetical protein